MKKGIRAKSGLQTLEARVFDLEVEEEGEIETLRLKDGEICWEGFRRVHGKLMRGVPKRTMKDCLKYCCHEGCDFT